MRGDVRAVLFDLDNTLADRERAFATWARRFARDRLGLEDPSVIEESVAYLQALDDDGRGAKDTMFRVLKKRHPVLSDDVETLVATFRDGLLDDLPPLDADAERLLAALEDRGVPWGIVSNGSANQLRKIRTLGLDGRTSCVVISELVEARKPDIAIFLAAAVRLGIDPGNALYVGDHPEFDIAGAGRAGMWTAWLRRGRDWPAYIASPPDFIIDSLLEILGVADRRPS